VQHAGEDVVPGPLGIVVIEAEPEVGHEGEADQAHQPHAHAQHERGGHRELGYEDCRVEQVDVGQQDVADQGGVPGIGGVVGELLGPILEAARDGQRELPQRTLEPHRADQQAA
jgi:hypothetical protein